MQSEPSKAMPINFNKKKLTCKIGNFYILLDFFNYHFAIDNHWYLLLPLPYKTLIKTKAKISILP